MEMSRIADTFSEEHFQETIFNSFKTGSLATAIQEFSIAYSHMFNIIIP